MAPRLHLDGELYRSLEQAIDGELEVYLHLPEGKRGSAWVRLGRELALYLEHQPLMVDFAVIDQYCRLRGYDESEAALFTTIHERAAGGEQRLERLVRFGL